MLIYYIWYLISIILCAEIEKSKEQSEKLAWYQENYDKLSSRYFELHKNYEIVKNSMQK